MIYLSIKHSKILITTAQARHKYRLFNTNSYNTTVSTSLQTQYNTTQSQTGHTNISLMLLDYNNILIINN